MVRPDPIAVSLDVIRHSVDDGDLSLYQLQMLGLHIYAALRVTNRTGLVPAGAEDVLRARGDVTKAQVRHVVRGLLKVADELGWDDERDWVAVHILDQVHATLRPPVMEEA